MDMYKATTTGRGWVRGFAALLALSVVIVGVPLALMSQVGWPLPTVVPSFAAMSSALRSNDVPDVFIVKLLAVIVWVAWLEVVASFVVEAMAIARGGVAARVRALGPVQVMTGALIGMVLTLSIPTKASTPQPPLAFALATSNVSIDSAQIADASPSTPGPSASEMKTYTVERRDNLWNIAGSQLGDSKRWPEIFELNKGTPQPDGHSLQRPELIRPGWVFQLPKASTSTGPSPVPEMPTEPTTTPATSSTTPIAVPDVQAPGAADLGAPTVEPEAQRIGGDASTVRVGGSRSHVVLASGSIVGLSLALAVSGALVILRNRRRRSHTAQAPLADIVFRDESVGDDLRAMRRLSFEAKESDPAESLPGVVAVGQTEGADVEIDLVKTGVARFGSESMDETRAFVLTHLLSGPAIDAEVRIVGAELAAELLGVAEMFDGLTVEKDIETTLIALESDLVSASRVFELVGVETLDELREQSPSDRMPVTLVVVREPSADQLLRLDGVVAQGRLFGITALVIGEASAETSTPKLDVQFRLTQAEAAKVADVVADTRRWNREESAAEGAAEPFDVPVVDDASRASVHVRLFGTPAIIVNGEEVQQKVRGKTLEFAAFLALRPGGVMSEVVGAALWPEANGKQVGERFATASSDLRRVLRDATGIRDRKFVERTHVGYRLDANLVSCDVWAFESALNEAANVAGDSHRSTVAIESAVGIYEAHFCEGAPYEWADDVREHFRRRALDACTVLSEAYEERGERMRALSLLERAMALDPFREDVYQRVMRIQCETEQFASAQRTGELIVSRLLSLNLEPSVRTTELISAARPARRIPLAG